MGERLLCKQEVDGSIPFTSTTRATGRANRRHRAPLGAPTDGRADGAPTKTIERSRIAGALYAAALIFDR